MVSLKERTVKGRTYYYLSTTASYKGRKKWLEKMIGPKGMDKKERERRVEFFTEILELKKIITELVLRSKYSDLKVLPKGYSFFLNAIQLQYETYLSNLYPPELEKYRQEFDVRYVNATNALEGNTLTLRETALVFSEGISPVNKKLREIHEVENYKKVLSYIRGYKKKLSIPFILRIHELIMHGIDEDSAGTFRKSNIKITGSEWEPPQGAVVESEMEILLEWYEKNKKTQDPFELACLFHMKFVQVHPFVDGNGRVGRELLNFLFQRAGYPMLIVPVEHRQRYLDALEAGDNGDPAPLLEFFAGLMITDYFSVVFQQILGPGGDLVVELDGLTEEEAAEVQEAIMWSTTQLMEMFSLGGQLPPELQIAVLSSFPAGGDEDGEE